MFLEFLVFNFWKSNIKSSCRQITVNARLTEFYYFLENLKMISEIKKNLQEKNEKNEKR